jgi:hypothetical protein
MLPFRKYWQRKMEWAPHQEARLSYFANTPDDDMGNIDENETQGRNEARVDGEESKAKRLKRVQNERKKRIWNLFEKRKAKESGAEKTREHLSSDELMDGYRTLHGTLDDFRRMRNPALIQETYNRLSDERKKEIEDKYGDIEEFINSAFHGNVHALIKIAQGLTLSTTEWRHSKCCLIKLMSSMR